MRALVVPQRLSNGKISTRTLRPIIVFFEDSGDSGSTGDSIGGKGHKSTNSKSHGSGPSGKKVSLSHLVRRFSADQTMHASSMVQFSTGDGTSNVPEDNHAQKAIKTTIADLQKRWKCDIHSKEKEKHCWQSEGICHELSFNHFGFWAIEIVGFDANNPFIL